MTSLHELYLERVAVHEKEVKRQREAQEAEAEAEQGLERLRRAGRTVPTLGAVPESPGMTALRQAFDALPPGDDPEASDLRRRREDYLWVQMDLLGEYDKAIWRRDEVRAALVRAFGEGTPEDERTARSAADAAAADARADAAETRAAAAQAAADAAVAALSAERVEKERLAARLRGVGIDPGSE